MIKCWDEGFLKLKKGHKAKLTCPATAAYGKRAMGAKIPADSDLVFEVELLDFTSAKPKQAKKEEEPAKPKDAGIPTKVLVDISNEEAGVGDFPEKGDKISVHYTGTLLTNGSKFDSSLDRKQPFEFKVGTGQVIKCWDEGFLQLKKGHKAKLTCPATSAYGKKAMGAIPANSDLVFEVELLDFTSKTPKKVPEVESGVTTTKGGVDLSTVNMEEFQVIKNPDTVGEGELPKANDKMKVHYTGIFADGSVFDSSVNRGQPFDFTLGTGSVIKCWD